MNDPGQPREYARELEASYSAVPRAINEWFGRCHCPCASAHPGDEGICEAETPVTTHRFETGLTGPVDVPLCVPCAAAQGVTELTAG